MSNASIGNNAFRELEDQNPAVAQAFRALRRRAQPAAPIDTSEMRRPSFIEGDYVSSYISAGGMFGGGQMPSLPPRGAARSKRRKLPVVVALLLLAAGLVALAFSVGPSVLHFLGQYWKAILVPTGGACLGAGVVLLASRLEAAPLRGIDPPNEDSDDLPGELKALAERTSSRLRSTYRFQLSAVIVVGAILVGLIVWCMVMVSQKRILYGSAFGSGGVTMVILTQWKWQPFDRINEARRLADNADTLATGLRIVMNTISEIQDPLKRAEAQADAIKQYLAWS